MLKTATPPTPWTVEVISLDPVQLNLPETAVFEGTGRIELPSNRATLFDGDTTPGGMTIDMELAGLTLTVPAPGLTAVQMASFVAETVCNLRTIWDIWDVVAAC